MIPNGHKGVAVLDRPVRLSPHPPALPSTSADGGSSASAAWLLTLLCSCAMQPSPRRPWLVRSWASTLAAAGALNILEGYDLR